MRSKRARAAIDGLYFIESHPLAKEAIEKHAKLE
jgi:hypothetical protein